MFSDNRTAATQIAAQWIIDQVYRWRYLDHDRAVAYLRMRCGEALLEPDEQGRIVISRRVRAAMHIFGAGHIVWEAELRRWRRRERYDAPWKRAA